MVGYIERCVLLQAGRCVSWSYDGTPSCSVQTGAKLRRGRSTSTGDYALPRARTTTPSVRYPRYLTHAGLCYRTDCSVVSTSRSFYIRLLLCGRPNRPHYGSCPSVRFARTCSQHESKKTQNIKLGVNVARGRRNPRGNFQLKRSKVKAIGRQKPPENDAYLAHWRLVPLHTI